MRRARVLLAGAAIALSPQLAQAEDRVDAPARDEQLGIFTLVLENDLFGETDRNYTSGFKLAYMTPAGAEPDWARRLADFTPPFAEDLDVRFEFELGQTIYTPEDLDLVDPPADDRPYAAVLYGSVGMIADADQRSFDQMQLIAGVIGPAALGEETQTAVHAAVGAVKPRGWDAQIDNRPVLGLRYQHTERLIIDGSSAGIDFDLAPNIGFSLGSPTTSASFGLGYRIGDNLPRDFGPPRIAPALPGSGYFVPNAQWGWYVFGGLEGRYVAYDVTLDERAGDGDKVKRKPIVGDAQIGLALHFKDVRLAYTQVLRTRQYREQRDEFSEFGAVSITLRR